MKSIRQMAAVMALLAISAVAAMAAVTVVSTLPAHHADGVDPAISSIKVRFSAPVNTGGWSFYNTQYGEEIPGTGDPVFEEGGLVCRWPVALKPSTTYSVSINNAKGGFFRSAADTNIRVTPYVITFTTAASS